MQSNRQPNWEKWRHFPNMEIWKAVALSLNIDPDSMKEFQRTGSTSYEPKEFSDRLEIAIANTGFGQKKLKPIVAVPTDRFTEISTIQFAHFAESVQWTLPKQFLRATIGVPADQPLHKAYWFAKAAWSEGELRDLMCGLEPDAARESTEEPNRAHEEIRRAVLFRELSATAISDATQGDRFYAHHRFYAPQVAIAWAASKRVLFPKFPFELSDIEKSSAVGTRERETLLKIIIAAAIDGYGYSPTEKKSAVPRELTEKLQQLGIPLDVDTVRKKLKEAAELLPDHPKS